VRFSLAIALLFAGCASSGAGPRAGGDPASATAPRSIDVGDRAPRFELALVSGGTFANTTGHPTLIVFWATWSQPDVKELLALEDVWRSYAPRGLRAVAISMDFDLKQLAAFALTYHLTIPIAWDEKHAVTEAYRPASDPTTYLVDADGKVRAVWQGYHGVEISSITSALDSALDPIVPARP
jgi:peroxiredoxin